MGRFADIRYNNHRQRNMRKHIEMAYPDDREKAQYDPLGSYTGEPADGEMPTQDADDL